MKPILLALAAVALAVTLWLALDGSQPELPQGGPAPAVVSELEVPAPGSAPTLDEGTSVADATPEREAVTVDPGSLHPDFGLELTAPAEVGTTFEVVVEGTDTPVPFAIVTVFDEGKAAASGARELLMSSVGLDEVLDRFGRHHRCDAEGRVQLADLGREVMLRAHGELGGRPHTGLLEGEPDTRRIEVRPELGFSVTVQDPVGVPLAGLDVQLNAERVTSMSTQRMTLNKATTDAGGRSFLANTSLSLPEQSRRLVGSAGRVLVSLAGLYVERPEVPVDWLTTTPAEITLVQPQVGRVEVRLSREGGGQLPRGVLYLAREGVDRELISIPGEGVLGLGLGGLSGEVGEHELLVFESIERGMAFDLVFAYEGGFELQERRGLAIELDQERLVVDLEVAVQAKTLSARLLLPGGGPLGGGLVAIGRNNARRSEQVQRLVTVRTDADGRFETLAPWLSDFDLVLSHRTAEGEELEVRAPQISRAQLAALSAVDLGDLTLTGETLLVAGKVVDSRGEGVSLQLTVRETPELPVGDPGQPGPRVLENAGSRWSVTSNDDGSFALLGRPRLPTLSLEVESENYLMAAALTLPVGTDDAVVQVGRAAQFRHDLSGLDEPFARGLRLSIHRGETSWTEHSYQEGRSPYLAPGTHDYVIWLGTEGAVAEGTVTLAVGEVADLGPLLPSGQVHHYEVHLTVEGDHNPYLLSVTGQREVEREGGGTSTETAGSSVKGGVAIWHIYSMEPLDHIEVQYGLVAEQHPANAGLTQLTLQVPEGADEEYQWMLDQGYL